jgi:hypothetical protein
MVARSRTGSDDDRRMAELAEAADRASATIRDRVWLTTAATLREHQHDTRPLEATIWLRAHALAQSAVAGLMKDNSAKGLRYGLFPTASAPVGKRGLAKAWRNRSG